jgi:hypothetical protein
MISLVPGVTDSIFVVTLVESLSGATLVALRRLVAAEANPGPLVDPSECKTMFRKLRAGVDAVDPAVVGPNVVAAVNVTTVCAREIRDGVPVRDDRVAGAICIRLSGSSPVCRLRNLPMLGVRVVR